MNAAFYFIFIACVVLKIGRDEQPLTSAIAILCVYGVPLQNRHIRFRFAKYQHQLELPFVKRAENGSSSLTNV